MKILFAFFIPLWLVFPSILLYNATSHGGRATIYALFTFWTSFIVISMANASKYDLTLALITYVRLCWPFKRDRDTQRF